MGGAALQQHHRPRIHRTHSLDQLDLTFGHGHEFAIETLGFVSRGKARNHDRNIRVRCGLLRITQEPLARLAHNRFVAVA